MAEDQPKKERPLLKIKGCKQTDCKKDLHCFAPPPKKRKKKDVSNTDPINEHVHSLQGACRECGAERVDWVRVHKRDIDDITYTNFCFQNEWARHNYWNIEIDGIAAQEAKNRGQVLIRQEAKERLLEKVASAKIFRDGVQTPRDGNVIFYVQHATATCCRKCLSYWHGIPPGREMTEDETEYCLNLIMAYIDARLPFLTKEGTVLCLEL